jgi:hypothetical protein
MLGSTCLAGLLGRQGGGTWALAGCDGGIIWRSDQSWADDHGGSWGRKRWQTRNGVLCSADNYLGVYNTHNLKSSTAAHQLNCVPNSKYQIKSTI